LRTFPRVTSPLTPRADPATTPTSARQSLQDALAWPIVGVLLLSAIALFLLPRIVPQPFVTLATGVAFATTTIALIGVGSIVAERWLHRQVATLAQRAETEIELRGVHGVVNGSDHLAFRPLVSAYTIAGARAGVRHAEHGAEERVGQLGVDASAAMHRVADKIRDALDRTGADASAPAVAEAHAALDELDAHLNALRQVTSPIPAPTQITDVVAELRSLTTLATDDDHAGRMHGIFETDAGPVRVDQHAFADALRQVLSAARDASPRDGVVTVHVSRIFRSTLLDRPVRRTGDSRLTIVPRASDVAIQEWVRWSRPSAEIVSVVISDAGAAPEMAGPHRALDAFAVGRNGDALGTMFASLRRMASSANGLVWVDGSREGGTSVHLLLPLAVSAEQPARA
jgi:signal transduction histidine kinase